MVEKYSLPHLPEGIEVVVVLLLTLVIARIIKMAFNRAIKRGKEESEEAMDQRIHHSKQRK